MERSSSSFRDEGGFVFTHQGTVFRHVDRSFQDQYDFLLSSGLYDTLTSKGLLIKHQEEDLTQFAGIPGLTNKVLRPEQVEFISYPFEWSFHQLKDAALATLDIQGLAIAHGMILKDASAFNIQFIRGKPCLLDTLSFIRIGADLKPWVAYKQFCEQFLAPLALMSYCDTRLNLLLRSFLEGVPIDLASELLPLKSNFSFGLLLHIHLHSRFHRKYSIRAAGKRKPARTVSVHSLLGLNESLKATILRLHPRKQTTAWDEYYRESNGEEYRRTKKEILGTIISIVKPKLVWDIGANNGEFSRVFSEKKIEVISLDGDPNCVDENYRITREKDDHFVHPLFLNITDPSPGLGWANKERRPFLGRNRPDLIVAFAVIHHLSISQNISFDLVARSWSALGGHLLIEFLERDDPRVIDLLSFKERGHEEYSAKNFESSFSKHYQLLERYPTGTGTRVVYLMKSLKNG
jgi:methyltransferase family protein